ncbi:MAG TPA: PilZ domain-containing protein [Pirellula sp.]|nr:PilZ domain-containing protein [Pirellula sp.]
MFSLLKQRVDPFNQRKKKQEVWKCLRRILDRNSAEQLLLGNEDRKEKRIPFSLPVLLQSCLADPHTWSEPVFAVTKDISDDGVAVIVHRSIDPSRVICVIWEDGPIFLSGEIRQCQPLGGGFWKIGMELSEIVSSGDFPLLRTLSERLSPKAEWL